MSTDIQEHVLITCPSTRRPENVPKMLEWCPDILFVVRDQVDVNEYKSAGHARMNIEKQINVADEVVGLPAARNTCLQMAHAQDKFCLQVDDDLQKLSVAAGGSNKRKNLAAIPSESLETAASLLYKAMTAIDAHLGALASNANFYFAKPRVHTWAFCCAQFVMINPDQPEWWHPTIDYKDEWEMTLRHLKKYRKVARLDWIVPTALHWNNPGGLCDNDNREAEDVQNARRLLQMYPDLVRKNTARKTRVSDLSLIHNTLTMPDEAKIAYHDVNKAFGFKV